MKRLLVVIFALAITASCNDVVDPTDRGIVEPVRPSYARTADVAELDKVTRELAIGLGEAAVRDGVRDAMRASLLTEHKIVLQDYTNSSGGRRFLSKAARENAGKAASLRRAITQLPDLDFYAPFLEDRLTWEATADVLLGSVLDPDDLDIRAYDTRGELVEVDVRNGSTGRPLLLLHPSEEKGRRINPQEATPGSVIQDSGDGQISGRIIWSNGDGRQRVVELADLVKGGNSISATGDCEDPTAVIECPDDGSGGVEAPSDTTFLNGYGLYFSDGAGSAEVEWRSEHSNGTKHTLRIECADCMGGQNPSPPWIMIFKRLLEGSSQSIWTEVWETDAFDDDHYGHAIFNYTDNGVEQETYVPCGELYDSTTCSLYGGAAAMVVASTFTPVWTPLY